MKKFIVAAFIALSLSACASDGGLILVKNPVSNVNLYEAELVFDAAIKSFVELRGLCVSRTLPPACRTYVKAGQGIITKAAAADIAARNFVANNPTLDATNVIGAFTGLLSDFQNTVTALSATK